MSEETPAKIEPTLKPIENAPSIVAAAPEPPPAETAKIEPTLEVKAQEPELTPKIEAKVEAKAEAAIEPPKVEANVAPAKEPPVMPRAAQIAVEPAAAQAPTWLRPTRAKEGKPAEAATTQPRSGSRFPLLAATVAIAACFGAIAGAFGGSLFGRAPEAPIVTHATKDTTDEIRALKETVAQLRTNTKSLNDNLAALKLGMSNANAQLTKMAEGLDRRAAAPATPETTGSIQKPAPAPVVLGAPPATLQHPIVQGWTLRRVYDGAALIEGREGVIEVEPGTTIPGLGRIEDIKRQDGRWAVFTSKGLIVSASK